MDGTLGDLKNVAANPPCEKEIRSEPKKRLPVERGGENTGSDKNI